MATLKTKLRRTIFSRKVAVLTFAFVTTFLLIATSLLSVLLYAF